MFEKRKLLIVLYVFSGLITAIMASFYLMKKGYIPEKVGSFMIIFYMISAFVIGNGLTIKYERSKVFRPYIANFLAENGFKLLEERPLTLSEFFKYIDLIPKPAIFVNDIPISRFGYKSKNYRMLKVQHRYDGLFWICAEIKITLKNKTRLRVLKQVKLDEKITTANIV